MATYITFGKYTTQGIANIKDSPSRLDAARVQLSALGVEIKEFYLTLGEYDFVTVVEAGDMKAATTALLALGTQGNVSTTTLAALDESEFREVVSAM